MPYTKSGPFTNGLPPALNMDHINNMETQYDQAMADSKAYTDKLAVSVASSMSQSAIQAVLNGVAAGTRVFFMPGTYTLAGPLTVAVDNTFIDAGSATFVQTTWGYPGFDAIGRNGCEYRIGMVQWSGTRGGQGTSYRGSAGYCSGAGIWINGDNNTVHLLRTSYMPVGIFFSAYAGTGTYDHMGVNNRVIRLEVDHANWGILYSWQQNLIIDDLYVHDDLDDSSGGNPTHAVYGSSERTYRSSGGQFKSLRAANILTGQPFQVKYHDGLRVDSMTASGSAGLLNVIECNDLNLVSYRSLNTLPNSGAGAITVQRGGTSSGGTPTNSQRPTFGPGYVQMLSNVDETPFTIIADYGDFDRIKIDSFHSSSVNPATVAEITVRGTGNVVRRPTMRSLGAGAVPGVWAGFGELANNTVIEWPFASGTLNMVKVGSSGFVPTGVTVSYDPTEQSVTGPLVDTTYGTPAMFTVPPSSLSTLGDDAALAYFLANNTVTVGAANSALQVKVTPKRNITVTEIDWWSVAASGNYDIAIVDDATNKVLWTRAAGSSTVAWPAGSSPAGAMIAETVPNIQLLAGHTYRIVFSADNATGTLIGITVSVAGRDRRLDGSTKTSTTGSAFPISTTSLVAGAAASTTRLPYLVLRGS